MRKASEAHLATVTLRPVADVTASLGPSADSVVILTATRGQARTGLTA